MGIVALLGVSGVQAQQAGAAPQAPQAQTPPDPLKFSLDGPIMLVFQIKPDKAAGFEEAWKSIMAGFAKATKPEVKAFGDTLMNKMSRVDFSLIGIPTPAGSPVVYMLQIDTPSKTMSYNPVKIIYETLHNNGAEGGAITRAEADVIYAKLKDGEGNIFLGINPWPLVKIGG